MSGRSAPRAEQQAHDAVQSEDDVWRQNGEIAALKCERDEVREQLRDATEANRVYAATLTALRVGIDLARAYKDAVTNLNGAADAEVRLFAWLGEHEKP